MSPMRSKICRPYRPIKLRLPLRIRSEKDFPNKRLHRLRKNQRRIDSEKDKIRPFLQTLKLSERQINIWQHAVNHIKITRNK
jgi:hypothetical protein